VIDENNVLDIFLKSENLSRSKRASVKPFLERSDGVNVPLSLSRKKGIKKEKERARISRNNETINRTLTMNHYC
jgi:hypothetical protein